MSEVSKTITYLVVALIVCVAAFFVSREAPEIEGEDIIGTMFVEIDKPRLVTRLKIVKFDSDEGQTEPFEVAKVDGEFSIPSHENYPADESDQLVNAVTGVNHIEILASVTDSSGNHKDFGVVDPTEGQLGKGAEGVGVRVTLSDESDKALADFIVGKEVKDAEGQRYVRHTGKNHVYTVKLNPDKLSTRFEDWIERDLLKLDPLNLSDVSINDYTVVTDKQVVLSRTGPREVNVVRGVDMKAAIELQYDQTDLKWELENMVAFERGLPQPKELAENEEINKTALDDMKTALDDLKIVDVHRKAKGLGDSLEEFINSNPQAADSLEEHGFYFRTLQGPDGSKQNVLLSNNGEVTVGMNDGVQYILRFGSVAGAEKRDENADGDGSSDQDGENNDRAADETISGKVLRNLLVITEFNEALIEQPELEAVPPETPEAVSGIEGEGNGQDGAGTTKPPSDDDDPPAAPSSDADPTATGEPTESDQDVEPCDGDEEADGDSDSPPAGAPGPAGDGTLPASDLGEGDTGATAADQAETEKEAEKELKEWQERRERIIKDNERKQKEYEDKIAAGKKRVEELNRRFADWYYVIPDDTYRKIHLTHKDVVKEKEKTEEEKAGEAQDPHAGEGGIGDTNGDDEKRRQLLNDLKDALPTDDEAE